MAYIFQPYYVRYFLRHFRPLVKEGRIFVSMPPLFRIDCGHEVRYALDEKEKEIIVNEFKKKKRKTKNKYPKI